MTSKPDNLPQAAKPGAPLLDQILVRGNLSAEDIERYQRVVVALDETIPSLGEIDAIIDARGRRPTA